MCKAIYGAAVGITTFTNKTEQMQTQGMGTSILLEQQRDTFIRGTESKVHLPPRSPFVHCVNLHTARVPSTQVCLYSSSIVQIFREETLPSFNSLLLAEDKSLAQSLLSISGLTVILRYGHIITFSFKHSIVYEHEDANGMLSSDSEIYVQFLIYGSKELCVVQKHTMEAQNFS